QKQIFVEKSDLGWGEKEFIPLNELHDPNNGYIVDDNCIITVEVTCWVKDDSTVKESSDSHKVPEAKRTKIKDERQ
ncbi:hypothetical protein MKX03_016581, partial [Papaver bracteatum]